MLRLARLLHILLGIFAGVEAWHTGPRDGLRRAFSLRAGSGDGIDDDPAGPPMPVIEAAAPEASRALVLMDCFCPYHGLYLAQKVQRDYPDVALVFVLSDYLAAYLRATAPEDPRGQTARLPRGHGEVVAYRAALSGLKPVAVYCESDAGLADAERLREELEVACRDRPTVWEARRHKFHMNEAVARAGLATAQQKLCTSLTEAQEFAARLLQKGSPIGAIVKPFRGVATESVFLCASTDDIARAWDSIVATKVFGSPERHSSVLVQEFLNGTEYAVDVVARNGDYKVAAVWRYDKRPANGAAFCYFRTRLVDQDSDSRVTEVVDYVKSSLKALGVLWGLSHNEVIVTEDRGPVLVEINCRQHNMDFLPLTMACIGYNALDMTLVALLDDDDAWQAFPELPVLRACGSMVHLVNYASGALQRVRFLEDLDALPGVINWEVYEEFQTISSVIKPTIDIRSDAGWAQLVNADPEQHEQAFNAIVSWMPHMFEVADEGG